MLVLVVSTLGAVALVVYGLRKTRAVADRISPPGARPTRIPLGATFTINGWPARVYALQGSFVFSARIPLRQNPRVLITRRLRRFPWLDVLHWSPARRRVRLGAPIDDVYSFRAGDPGAARQLFSDELQDALLTHGRVSRMTIDASKLQGHLYVLRHTPEELELARQSVATLSKISTRLAESSLAEPRP